MSKQKTSISEPICVYCKTCILTDLVEIPVQVKYKEKPKPPLPAHRKCWREYKLEEQDKELLIDYTKSLKFPEWVLRCLGNYHEYGSRSENNPGNNTYPWIVIFNALKKGESYIQWMQDKGIFKDDNHKINMTLKKLDADLEAAYAEWEETQERFKEGE